MSWYQLLAIRKQAREEWLNTPGNGLVLPVACPTDGEPLNQGPPGSGVILYCPFDGWRYPQDWVQPQRPAELFG